MTTLLHCSNRRAKWGKWSARGVRVAASPVEQGLQHRAERPAFCGQDIFGARRVLLVEMAFDDAGFLEPLQPGGQRIGADAGQRMLEILESARPLEQQVAQDQDRPALADDVERAGDRAAHIVIRNHPAWIRHHVASGQYRFRIDSYYRSHYR